jgi:hypothetical protein
MSVQDEQTDAIKSKVGGNLHLSRWKSWRTGWSMAATMTLTLQGLLGFLFHSTMRMRVPATAVGWLWGREHQVLLWRCWQVSRFAVSYMLRLCRVRFSIRNQPWLQLAPNSSCRDDCKMEYEKGIVLLGWNGRRKLSWSRHHDFGHCVFSWLAVLSRFLVTLWAQLL